MRPVPSTPQVTGEPYIRFYAGCPLISPDGCALGTLCVIDQKPRQLDNAQADTLRRLSRQLVNLLELRRLGILQRYAQQQLMQQILDRYASGVLISSVTLQAVQPPEQVQIAFDDAVKAGQDRERQKNEGQAYANDVIPKARGYAFRLVQEAEAYRATVSENAAGNAARFKQVLAEYQKAPAVTRDRMYLETMQQIFSSASKVMVDAKSGSNLLYLPLDKLIAQAAASDAAAAAAKAAAAPAPAPAPAASTPSDMMPTVEMSRQRDSRSRDSSRERESR